MIGCCRRMCIACRTGNRGCPCSSSGGNVCAAACIPYSSRWCSTGAVAQPGSGCILIAGRACTVVIHLEPCTGTWGCSTQVRSGLCPWCCSAALELCQKCSRHRNDCSYSLCNWAGGWAAAQSAPQLPEYWQIYTDLPQFSSQICMR